MNRIMLDLETMGNSATAAIIAIGAARFGEGKITDEFYTVVDLESSVAAGLTIDPATVLWWMKQNDTARSQFERKGQILVNALYSFSQWIEHDAEVWGNGVAFDNVILSNAYRAVGLQQPWSFRDDRCYRTVARLNPSVKLERQGTYHNAVDDARSQAMHLMKILGI